MVRKPEPSAIAWRRGPPGEFAPASAVKAARGGRAFGPMIAASMLWLVPAASPVVAQTAAEPAPVQPLADGPGRRAAQEGGRRNGVVGLTDRRRGPIAIDGAYRVIETKPDAVVHDVVIDGLTATNVGREGVRLKAGGVYENVTFRNFHLQHAPTPNVAPDLPEGFHFEAGRGLRLENGVIEGFQMTRGPKQYWNGDGVATEGAVEDFTAIKVTAKDNTDAGFDLKSKRNALDDVTLSGNCRNLRIWPGSKTEIGTLTSEQPLCRGGSAGPTNIYVAGSYAQPPVIHIKHLIVRQTRKTHIFELSNGPAVLDIDQCDIQTPPGTPFFYGLKPQGSLGPGCQIPGS